MKEQKNRVTQEEYYKNRLEDVIKSGCTKEELETLMKDLDMDTDVGGEWLYVHPADRFLFKTMKEAGYLTIPVVCNDGTPGTMDIYSIDFSCGDEGKVRIGVDGLFELEFNFVPDNNTNSRWVDVRVISSEAEEPCRYDGGKIYLDPQMCLLVEDSLDTSF